MQFLIQSQHTSVLRLEDLADLPNQVARLTHIEPASQVLSSAGRLLSTPADFGALREGATIRASARLPGGVVKKRCQRTECTQPALRNLNCSLCAGQFCAKHRLLEQHSCAGLANCKDELRRANQAKLESERCVAPKVV